MSQSGRSQVYGENGKQMPLQQQQEHGDESRQSPSPQQKSQQNVQRHLQQQPRQRQGLMEQQNQNKITGEDQQRQEVNEENSLLKNAEENNRGKSLFKGLNFGFLFEKADKYDDQMRSDRENHFDEDQKKDDTMGKILSESLEQGEPKKWQQQQESSLGSNLINESDSYGGAQRQLGVSQSESRQISYENEFDSGRWISSSSLSGERNGGGGLGDGLKGTKFQGIVEEFQKVKEAVREIRNGRSRETVQDKSSNDVGGRNRVHNLVSFLPPPINKQNGKQRLNLKMNRTMKGFSLANMKKRDDLQQEISRYQELNGILQKEIHELFEKDKEIVCETEAFESLRHMQIQKQSPSKQQEGKMIENQKEDEKRRSSQAQFENKPFETSKSYHQFRRYISEVKSKLQVQRKQFQEKTNLSERLQSYLNAKKQERERVLNITKLQNQKLLQEKSQYEEEFQRLIKQNEEITREAEERELAELERKAVGLQRQILSQNRMKDDILRRNKVQVDKSYIYEKMIGVVMGKS